MRCLTVLHSIGINIFALLSLTSIGSGTDPENLIYLSPKELGSPIDFHFTTLVGGGPTNHQARSIKALQNPAMGNFESATLKVKKGLRYLFQTENPWTVALSGSGSIGIEVVLDNLVEPGDIVLVPSIGLWGKRTADIVGRLGAIVHEIEKPLGTTFSLEEIEEGILKFKPQVIYITNGESSTGAHQKIKGIGELCRKHNCLLLVDVVATVGIIPFHFDTWKIDVAICNTQKAIGAPTGLAPMTFGPRAMDKIFNRKSKPKSYYMDIKNNWIPNNYWQFDHAKAPTFHSSYPVLQFYALREALAAIAAEGLQTVWNRHDNATMRLKEGLRKFGLKDYVENPDDRLTGTITVYPPQGVDPKQLTAYVRDKFHFGFDIGIGQNWGKLIRFGIFGPNATPEIVDQALNALKDGLDHFAPK